MGHLGSEHPITPGYSGGLYVFAVLVTNWFLEHPGKSGRACRYLDGISLSRTEFLEDSWGSPLGGIVLNEICHLFPQNKGKGKKKNNGKFVSGLKLGSKRCLSGTGGWSYLRMVKRQGHGWLHQNIGGCLHEG